MLDGDFGNPASTSHVYGWEAAELVEQARSQVAELINASPLEIIWTSGATESDNLAIKGVLEADVEKNHLVTSSYEHKAVLDTCEYLEDQGASVTYVRPQLNGTIDPEEVCAAITTKTALVSVMHVNNELGTVNAVGKIGEHCRANNVLFHVDAAQSVGKIPVDVARDCIDLLSISGHKIYGPKGIGAVYVRAEIAHRLAAQIHGGGHEQGIRSGTLPTHQIVGLGEAAHLSFQFLEREGERILRLRKRLLSHLRQMPNVHLNGDEDARIPGVINVGFDDVDGETLLNSLSSIAVSSGSACTSATVEPSYVLQAIGVPYERAAASLRFSIGRFTSEEDVDLAASEVANSVHALRA